MTAANSVSADGREFLASTAWCGAECAPITGDASARRYYRLRQADRTAVLMDASRVRECVGPFFQIARHLHQLGFSVPGIFEERGETGFALLEDFGNSTFTRLLDNGAAEEPLYTLATDLLIALHQRADAIPAGLRAYHPQKMLEDIELFLDWCAPKLSAGGREEFRAAWSEALPLAHQVPESLLLRDYHVANLMLLPERQGVRQAGLLDFQDAYRGPVSYDLVSLLEDARRDVPEPLRRKMIARYLAAFPGLDAKSLELSLAILAAQRHTRVLGIFERLSTRDGKPDYKQLHSPRVQRLLQNALAHPALARVRNWYKEYAA